jgi:hypothetical protein
VDSTAFCSDGFQQAIRMTQAPTLGVLVARGLGGAEIGARLHRSHF